MAVKFLTLLWDADVDNFDLPTLVWLEERNCSLHAGGSPAHVYPSFTSWSWERFGQCIDTLEVLADALPDAFVISEYYADGQFVANADCSNPKSLHSGSGGSSALAVAGSFQTSFSEHCSKSASRFVRRNGAACSARAAVAMAQPDSGLACPRRFRFQRGHPRDGGVGLDVVD